jgi:hypothetical protein
VRATVKVESAREDLGQTRGGFEQADKGRSAAPLQGRRPRDAWVRLNLNPHPSKAGECGTQRLIKRRDLMDMGCSGLHPHGQEWARFSRAHGVDE